MRIPLQQPSNVSFIKRIVILAKNDFENQVRVTPDELQNVFSYIKGTISKAINGHSEMCDSISQIGHVLGLIGLTENFTVRAPNCCCDDKHHKTRSKAKLQACENILQNNHLLDRNGITKNNSVRGPKCRLHDQHHKSR